MKVRTSSTDTLRCNAGGESGAATDTLAVKAGGEFTWTADTAVYHNGATAMYGCHTIMTSMHLLISRQVHGQSTNDSQRV